MAEFMRVDDLDVVSDSLARALAIHCPRGKGLGAFFRCPRCVGGVRDVLLLARAFGPLLDPWWRHDFLRSGFGCGTHLRWLEAVRRSGSPLGLARR